MLNRTARPTPPVGSMHVIQLPGEATVSESPNRHLKIPHPSEAAGPSATIGSWRCRSPRAERWALTTRVCQEIEQFFIAVTTLENKAPRILGWDDGDAAPELIRATAI